MQEPAAFRTMTATILIPPPHVILILIYVRVVLAIPAIFATLLPATTTTMAAVGRTVHALKRTLANATPAMRTQILMTELTVPLTVLLNPTVIQTPVTEHAFRPITVHAHLDGWTQIAALPIARLETIAMAMAIVSLLIPVAAIFPIPGTVARMAGGHLLTHVMA